MKISKLFLLSTALVFIGQAHGAALEDLKAFVVDEKTPIIFSEKNNLLVLEGANPEDELKDIQTQSSDFKAASEISTIKPYKPYWLAQKLVSHLKQDRILRLDARYSSSNWVESQHYVLYKDGRIEKLKRQGRGSFSVLAELNPFTEPVNLSNSQYSIFTLPKDEEVLILSRLESASSFQAKSFSIGIYDNGQYLELRRYGLYIEGLLLGSLIALLIFGWFSVYQYRDKTSFAYGCWLVFGLMSVFSLPVHDGHRLFEFVINLEDQKWGIDSAAIFIANFFAYGQTIVYVIFARNFLEIKKYFPRFYTFTNIWIVWEFIHFYFLAFVDHGFTPTVFLGSLGILIVAVLLSIYYCALIRLRQGLMVAKFFMVAMIPYLCFRTVFILGVIGVPSPFSFLPKSGFGLFFQNSFTNQAFGLCCEAMIMALAVISRTRWIQRELTQSVETQKTLVEGQNKVLEETVAERTKELAEQHQELDQAHQLVVGSVNYASRLQRGQLPRQERIKDRFASFASIWEPRDTIGGDLYWLSSSQQSGPFVMAVADCTGHGVPGAMLSLLVSNSFERIYANDTAEDPATALMSLDHYVRTGLNQDRADSESDDGCDAAVLRINRDKQTIEFAGAKLGLFQVSAIGEVIRHLAARCSLGYQDAIEAKDKPVVQNIRYQAGDIFAIVTDGLTDQIGGTGAVKVSYGYKRIETILKANCSQNAQTIADAVRADYAAWQGTESRRDDVTAVFFKL